MVAVVVLLADVTVLLAGGSRPPPLDEVPPRPTSADGAVTRARDAARRFLDGYVDRDGRVVRHDEGGDTVSEGQAYAMLLAVALEDADGFARVWEWTRTNIQRQDGLLSWRWADGAVADPSPAADADVDAARALLLAAERFGQPSYEDAARRILAAILEHETAEDHLVAGPWARSDGYVNPSYLDPAAFRLFEAASGDERWGRLLATTYTTVEQLGTLPPDWARLEAGQVVPTGPPGDPHAEPTYGLDAQRLPVRLMADRAPRGRELAAAMWPVLSQHVEAGGPFAVQSLDGEPLVDWRHPLSSVAAAASAGASSESQTMFDLLDRAEEIERAHPEYYGSAWVALGRVLLTTDLLDEDISLRAARGRRPSRRTPPRSRRPSPG